MAPVQAVLLDLDATLLDYDQDFWAQSVGATAAALAGDVPGLPAERLARVYRDLAVAHWRTVDATESPAIRSAVDGYLDWRAVWGQALASLGHPEPGLAERAAEEYRRVRNARYRLYEDVPEVLPELRHRAGAVGLVTNGASQTQRDKIAVTGLSRYLDVIVISGEAGVAKPDPGIFDIALGKLGVPPEAAWHVGDSLGADIAGARNAGLAAAVWLNRSGAALPAGAAVPTHEIRSLRDVLALLDSQAQPGR
jgi:HAD superfamily hydrolase (TIGR01549 family)